LLDRIGFFDKAPLQAAVHRIGPPALGLVFKGVRQAVSLPAAPVPSRLAYCLYLVHLAPLPMAQVLAKPGWFGPPEGRSSRSSAAYLLIAAAALILHYTVKSRSCCCANAAPSPKSRNIAVSA
jgi:hypothetical protein